MDLQLAAAAVDWMAERIQELGRRILKIHFFGGEPFCAGEVVDAVIHRARTVAANMGLTPHFEVSTNGFYDENRCRFIGDHFNTVVLSFDGPEEIQNRNRPTRSGRGTFQTVARNAGILSQSPAELCIRACITQDTVGQMEEIGRWFCETFRPSIINFETLQPTPESESAGLKSPDPWELAIHYIQAARVVERYGVRPVYAAAMTETTRLSFCPVGTDAVIISPDGRMSACYLLQREWKARGLNMDMGILEATGRMNINQQAVERIRNLPIQKSRCQRCFARWHCAGGCHVNHSFPGCAEEYDAFCIQTRIIMACHLLDELGCMELVDRLVQDRQALEDLALQPSDRLEDVGVQGVGRNEHGSQNMVNTLC